MPTALPLTDLISQGSTRKRKFRVLKAQFGDGYLQTAPDGVNHQIDQWNLIFANLTLTDRATLWSAIETVGASDYLTWTPPGDTAKKWKIVSEISESPQSGDIYTISFDVMEVF